MNMLQNLQKINHLFENHLKKENRKRKIIIN